MYCLSEMAVAHPTAGSFGVYADLYVSPWAGFVVRYTYWAAQSIALGGEAVAAAIYTQWWFPNTPVWVWVVVYSVLLIFVNASSVGAFGTFEYWFSMIKVTAIGVFIVLGAAVLLGVHQQQPIGLANFHAHGGFLPHGWLGVWMALAFVIFSFIGTEIVAVTAGEAKDPERSVPRAMRTMLLRLVIFYVGAITVLVGVIPWTEIQPGQSVTVSPFVRVFDVMHVPIAAQIVNFVVLTAALSGMNCCLYLATRMIFSLARGGYAPAALGRVSRHGAPIPALLMSAVRIGDRHAGCDSVSRIGVCLHVRHRALRWPVCLADDLRHASFLSSQVGSAGRPHLARTHAAVSRDHDRRRASGAGDHHLHLVGGRHEADDGVGYTVARGVECAVLRLEAT